LQNFTFVSGIVYKQNHQLNVSDLILTDKFELDKILLFRVVAVNDDNSFKVTIMHEVQFIYKDIIWSSDSFCEMNDPTKIIPCCKSKNICHVAHEKHNLSLNKKIRIKINSSDKICRITRVFDANNYEVILPMTEIDKFDLIKIYYPDIFQLLFNREDTLGPFLSFRNCTDKGSITKFSHKICNLDPYDTMDSRLSKEVHNMYFDYFYIVCPELNTGLEYYRNIPINNVFAQIRWFYNDYGGIVFDSFVQTKKIFYAPIDVLRELHIQIVHPDGRPVDFGGLDHSFTIKITEIFNQPINTDISARINAEILPGRV
jgi:hypothetical protein